MDDQSLSIVRPYQKIVLPFYSISWAFILINVEQTLIGHNKKQSVVARSSLEVEFRAMAHGVCGILW